MARYINKDEFIAQIQDNFCTECNNYNGVKCKSCGIDDTIEMVENADEVDVVPRCEVERLEQENETLKDNNEHLAVLIAEAKTEVAREIFEEIDKRFEALLKFYPCNGEFEDAKSFVDFHWKHIRHSIMCDYDSELKKKYTENKEDWCREIFEEIEEILSDNFHADCQMGDCVEDYYDDNLRDDIAELKKKYTENKEDWCNDKNIKIHIETHMESNL